MSEEEIEEINRHDEEVRRTIDDLTDQINSLRRENGGLSRDLQVARRERGTVEAARDSAQERERHAIADREKAWKELGEIKNQLGLSEGVLRENLARVQSLQDENTQLKSDLGHARSAEKQLVEAHEQISDLECEIIVTRARLEAALGAEAYAKWQEGRRSG